MSSVARGVVAGSKPTLAMRILHLASGMSLAVPRSLILYLTFKGAGDRNPVE
jgi:hypothetical protein